MTFQEVIEKLRDGHAYRFTTPNLGGFFYKAPFPEHPDQTKRDRAASAITYYNKASLLRDSPTLMLYDFDSNEWTCFPVTKHPEA